MTTITIPKKINQDEKLVAIPHKEYAELLRLKNLKKRLDSNLREALAEIRTGKIKEYTLTPTDKRALAKAEKNLREGKTLSYNELAKKLGIAS